MQRSFFWGTDIPGEFHLWNSIFQPTSALKLVIFSNNQMNMSFKKKRCTQMYLQLRHKKCPALKLQFMLINMD